MRTRYVTTSERRRRRLEGGWPRLFEQAISTRGEQACDWVGHLGWYAFFRRATKLCLRLLASRSRLT